jgi:hypothetical protein
MRPSKVDDVGLLWRRVASKIQTHSLPFNLRPSRLLRCCHPCPSLLAYPSAFPGPAVGRAPWHFFTHLLLARLSAHIKHFVVGCVYSDPMDTTPEGLPDKLYWRKARGEWHCFKKLPQGPWIHLTLPRPGNLIRAGAANRPARDPPAVQLVRWTGDGAAGLGRLRSGFAPASRELQ